MVGQDSPTIGLPKSWTGRVRFAVLHVISLAQYATIYTRSWAANSLNARVRLKAENNRLRQEVALLEEEIRIKDARTLQISPHKRPHYPPIERMAILELRAARSWSLQQTANAFHLTAATVSTWMHRLDESGPDALVQLCEPVNKFPEFVRYAVQRLKALALPQCWPFCWWVAIALDHYSRRGLCCLHGSVGIGCDASLPGKNRSTCRHFTEIPHLRQRRAVLVRGFQGLVPTPRHPATRCHTRRCHASWRNENSARSLPHHHSRSPSRLQPVPKSPDSAPLCPPPRGPFSQLTSKRPPHPLTRTPGYRPLTHATGRGLGVRLRLGDSSPGRPPSGTSVRS